MMLPLEVDARPRQKLCDPFLFPLAVLLPLGRVVVHVVYLAVPTGGKSSIAVAALEWSFTRVGASVVHQIPTCGKSRPTFRVGTEIGFSVCVSTFMYP